MDASLGLSVVPVQYLEDGLEIGWSAVEAADAYELSVVTDNDYFTLHRTIPASGETQYRVHLDRSELAGHGPYMVTVNATAQGVLAGALAVSADDLLLYDGRCLSGGRSQDLSDQSGL